ncbi:MAG: LLM class flavin-dependent oxidoreductase [Actinomycetia bacterium]|nr:LLM class flavin-dependent oxidoreductase [Actinomycetes bacterium]
MQLGVLYNTDRMVGPDLVAYAQRLERLGHESLWVPELFGREPLALAGWLLAATEKIMIVTGIINVYARDAVATAAGATTLAEMSGGRFHLGLGVSNRPLNEVRGHDNWIADGYDESDVADGGSDRLIDDLVTWGSVDEIRDQLMARTEAGADRVVVIPLNAAGGHQPDWDLLETLAE